MAAFSVSHQTAAGSTLPLINLTGSASVRAGLFYICIGSDATPADQAGEIVLDRTTDAGTGGTALTEVPLDPIQNPATATCAAVGGTFGVVPTRDSNTILLMVGLHQKATFQWYAASESSRFFSKLTSANGLELLSVAHTATPNLNCTLHWNE